MGGSYGIEKARGYTMIKEDQLWKLSVKIGMIKSHLKDHFDLDGDNQPWHMFDSVKADIRDLVNDL